MALRFFADHCVSSSVIKELREAGHEVLRLQDYLPPDSPDPLVIAKAQELGAISVSLNGDFADLVRYPPSSKDLLDRGLMRIGDYRLGMELSSRSRLTRRCSRA